MINIVILNSQIDIIFTETKVNLNWTKVMKEVRGQIKKDLNRFLKDGGWDFLQDSSDDDNQDRDEESPSDAEDDVNKCFN
jgi:nucleosome binding factor SPN SPT16 subunit